MSGPSFDAWENDLHRLAFGFCLSPCDHPACHGAEPEDESTFHAYDDENTNGDRT